METPEKYKSLPTSILYNRNIVLLSTEQKVKIQSILQNFIQYLLAKHS
jgi:hypothetical protein